METSNRFSGLFKMSVWFLALTMLAFNVSAVNAQEEEVVVTEEASDYEGFVLAVPTIPVFDEALDAVSEVSPVSVELGMTVSSAYIWRGQNLGSDASVQPWVTASTEFLPVGSLSFTYWMNYTKNQPDRNWSERDYNVDYSFDVTEVLELGGFEGDLEGFGKVLDFNFNTGYIYYDFPASGGSKSQEVYFGLTYNLPLSPSFYIYHDWDRGDGQWYELGVSHDFDLKAFTVATYATLGYNDNQWGQSEDLSTLDFGASIPIPVGDHMTIEPFISYTKRLNATYADDGSDLTHDELYGGFNYTFSF